MRIGSKNQRTDAARHRDADGDLTTAASAKPEKVR
jgi:hypothetical protein